jgi:hypothetical protein
VLFSPRVITSSLNFPFLSCTGLIKAIYEDFNAQATSEEKTAYGCATLGRPAPTSNKADKSSKKDSKDKEDERIQKDEERIEKMIV